MICEQNEQYARSLRVDSTAIEVPIPSESLSAEELRQKRLSAFEPNTNRSGKKLSHQDLDFINMN